MREGREEKEKKKKVPSKERKKKLNVKVRERKKKNLKWDPWTINCLKFQNDPLKKK